jgi:glycosyltransferase involved in cell wall biosynthesis
MDYAAPYRGNFISAIESLENHYQDRGNTVFLFPKKAEDLPWVKNMAGEGKRIYFIDASFYSKKVRYSNLKTLDAIVKKENIGIIHTHFIEYNYSLFIYKKLYPKNIRFIANYHNNYFPSGRLYLLKNWIIKHTIDFFIGDSQSVSESLIKIGVPCVKVKTINNSINFSRLNESTEMVIKKPGSTHSVLMFGYPWYRKGVDVVAKTLLNLNKEREVPVTFALAQAGCVEATSDAIIKTLGFLPDWVNFLGPREDLASYYNAATIFISAGREEGLSYAPLEAAYCNCSVICSNIPGNPLDIPELSIYEVEDNISLKKEIELLLNVTKEEKSRIKKIQRDYVVRNYNINVWVEKIAACY